MNVFEIGLVLAVIVIITVGCYMYCISNMDNTDDFELFVEEYTKSNEK